MKTLIGPCTIGVTCDNWWDFFNPGEWLEDAGESILDRIATGIGEFAQQLLSGIWWAIGEATTPDVNAEFLQLWFSRTLAISLPLMVGFMILQGIITVLRTRGAGGLGRMIIGAGVGVLGSFLALPVIALLVAAMDALAMDLARLSHEDIGSMVTEVMAMLIDPSSSITWVGGGVLGSMGAILAGIFAILGAIAVFIALLVRMMLLYIVVIIGPFAFAGLVWEPTRQWIRTWLTLVVALVFSKLGVVLVFGLGVSMISSLDFAGDGALAAIGQLVAGLMMLFMAALVPWACFKFFSFIGEESAAALQSGTASTARARAGGMVHGASAVGHKIAAASATGGAGVAAAAGLGATAGSRTPRTPTNTYGPGDFARRGAPPVLAASTSNGGSAGPTGTVVNASTSIPGAGETTSGRHEGLSRSPYTNGSSPPGIDEQPTQRRTSRETTAPRHGSGSVPAPASSGSSPAPTAVARPPVPISTDESQRQPRNGS